MGTKLPEFIYVPVDGTKKKPHILLWMGQFDYSKRALRDVVQDVLGKREVSMEKVEQLLEQSEIQRESRAKLREFRKRVRREREGG